MDLAKYPPDRYPYLEPKDWADHQTGTTDKWHKVWNSILVLAKYKSLSLSQRGMLHGIWAYRAVTGLSLPRDPTEARLSLSVAPTKHFRRSLDVLILRGFLIPKTTQRRGDKKRGDKKPISTRRTGLKSAQVEYLPGFETFWKSTRTRFGPRGSKPDAALAWNDLGHEGNEDSLLRVYRAQYQEKVKVAEGGRDPQPFKHLCRWLRHDSDDLPDALARSIHAAGSKQPESSP